MCILSDPVEYPDMFSGVPVGSSNINSQYQSYTCCTWLLTCFFQGHCYSVAVRPKPDSVRSN